MMKGSTFVVRRVGLLVVLTVCWTVPARAQITTPNIDPVDRWAWGTDIGWVNLRPETGGVAVYPDHLEGWAWGENVGWIRFGTNESGFAHTYANDSAATYGVNHDGSGNLSGYAWGSNVGWVNFAPGSGGVTIDLQTGRFGGYAWAENVGWISFRGTGDVAYNVKLGAAGIRQWPIPTLGVPGILLLTAFVAGLGILILRRAGA